ncbi:MAG: hypothetical protein O7A63_01050 [Acidobacteria bacterium]|nr:hypothetical protein [Acidobacteriota bacterium]
MWRLIGAALILTGCQLRPADPIERATLDARRGKFLRALTVLDRLPPSHERYTDARTLAQALERRIRTSHEKVLEGLALRHEWRDEEALTRFREALEIWPDVAGANGLIRATELRIIALRRDGGTPLREVAKGETGPATKVGDRGTGATPPVAGAESQPPAPLGETRVTWVGPRRPAARSGTIPSPEEVDPARSGPGKDDPRKADPVVARPRLPRTPQQERRRRRMLGRFATLMRAGEMDRAFAILENLWEESPGDRIIARELVRVQHQRALLAYGQGRLRDAIAGWEQVVRLAPEDTQSKAFLRAARTELKARKR